MHFVLVTLYKLLARQSLLCDCNLDDCIMRFMPVIYANIVDVMVAFIQLPARQSTVTGADCTTSSCGFPTPHVHSPDIFRLNEDEIAELACMS
jgi:hypothetical protein